ncbi:MAG: FAD-dependent oxidoreductase [Candidatus Izemoplasmatales bacterium]
MKAFDVIVIGGSAAGVTAAITTRKYYPNKSILMIKNVKNVPIPCGIPYIFGTVGDPMKNLLPTDTMMVNNKIDVSQDEVVEILKDQKILKTAQGETFQYDKLVMANGSLPIVPRIPGNDLKNVFSIIKNADSLKTMLDTAKTCQDFVVIGGGFIGMEMAEEIKKMSPDANVTIVEMQTHCLQLVYDADFCLLAEKAMADQGINILTNEQVVGLEGKEYVQKVLLASKKEIKADCVILGIGCTPNTALSEATGIKIGPAKGVLVNRYMQTSDPNIFACGDVADKVSFFDGKPSALRLASISTAEARVAGINLFSIRRTITGVIGVFSTFLGKKTFAAAGLTEREAKQKGYQIVIGDAESINRHPGGMPGAETLKVRLIFEAGSKVVLGGQIYGATSGGELINVVGALISQKSTAEDIVLFQAGTHPALTASPVAYQLVNAAENALVKMTF